MVKWLRMCPLTRFAAEYLNAVLEHGEQKELMLALRRIADAFGGVPKLAEQAELNATMLYRTLSPQGNPELKSLSSILKAIGMRIAVEPIKSPLKVSHRRTLVKKTP